MQATSIKPKTVPAWAIMSRGKIMKVGQDLTLELYATSSAAERALRGIRLLHWVKGRPKIVQVEIQILK